MGIESAGLGFSVGLDTGIYEQSMDRLCENGLSESDPSNLMHRTPSITFTHGNSSTHEMEQVIFATSLMLTHPRTNP